MSKRAVAITWAVSLAKSAAFDAAFIALIALALIAATLL